MRNLFKRLFKQPDIPDSRSKPPEADPKIQIRDIAKQTFPANYGRTSVWNFNNPPNNPTADNFLDNIDGLYIGDIVTWRMGPYYIVVKKNGKLVLQKRDDQTPPK